MPSPQAIAVLHRQLLAVCPIEGISIGSWTDRQTWRIDFLPTATPDQQLAARQLLATFDPEVVDVRSALATALDVAITATPSIDPRIKAVFMEWRKQVT